ncbi:MAG: ATP-binding cassette domain-containing protein [Armatimonadetes bacterium]|nr:ATP-binding cassette domain-containing protein [Armatimonadota bacterium]
MSKTYEGGVQALKPLTMEFGDGVFALLGPNGSGKTTFMRMLATLLEPTSGTARVDGFDIQRDRPQIRRLLGYLPQDFGFYPGLTVTEQLDYLALLSDIRDPRVRRDAVDRVLTQVNMQDFRERPVDKLSGGMKQRVGIAAALLGSPQLLIIDEPTSGLDPEERIRIRSLLAELGHDRVIIISTHIVADVEATADQLVILWLGELLLKDTVEGLIEKTRGRVWSVDVEVEEIPRLKQAYTFTGVFRASRGIQVRVIADAVDHPRAVAVEPTLEDAYIGTIEAARARAGVEALV